MRFEVTKKVITENFYLTLARRRRRRNVDSVGEDTKETIAIPK